MLALACGSTTSAPAPAVADAGRKPACPVGPAGRTSSPSTLPSGACQANEGPCAYEATPCPDVVNGAVNGYECSCQSGSWSCPIVNQTGMCAPLPTDDGGTVTGPNTEAGPPGPTGSTGPAQP
jgi:hypothetical protein